MTPQDATFGLPGDPPRALLLRDDTFAKNAPPSMALWFLAGSLAALLLSRRRRHTSHADRAFRRLARDLALTRAQREGVRARARLRGVHPVATLLADA